MASPNERAGGNTRRRTARVPRPFRLPIPPLPLPLPLALLLLLLFWTPARAQFTRFQSFTDEQGLGNLVVRALAQDADGYILFGTEDGLFRYDGSGFSPVEAVTRLASSGYVQQIENGRDGRTWILTRHDLLVGRGNDYRRVELGRPAPDLEAPHLLAVAGNAVVLDIDGVLFRGTAAAPGADAFAPLLDPDAVSRIPGLGRARFVVSDGDDGLLIGCGAALCRRTASGRIEVMNEADGLPSDVWQVALRAADGTVWVRSLGRLAWRRPGERSFTTVAVPRSDEGYLVGHPEALALLSDGGRGVFTQSDDDLTEWTGSSWRFYAPHHRGLSSAAPLALLRDRESSLWVGTYGSGASRSIGIGNWEHWTTDDGLSSNLVWSTLRRANGQMWIATDHGVGPLLGTPEADGNTLAIAESRAGRLWTFPDDGPMSRRERDGPFSISLPSLGHVTGAVIGPDNRLWLTTHGALFVLDDADAPAAALHPTLVLPVGDSRPVIDPAGGEWIVSTAGVFRGGRNGMLSHPVIRPDQLVGTPMDAAFAAGGDLWIGTLGHGLRLFRLHDGGADELPPIQAPLLASDTILSVFRDHRGWMWIGTDRGIDMFDGIRWRRFDSASGPINNDNSQWGTYEDRDGSLWFGTSGGLSHLVDPTHLPEPTPLHPLVTRVSYGTRILRSGSAFHLPWSPAPLVIRFVDLDYARPRGAAFHYRMIGVDPSWTETTGHEVRYAQLPAGDLRFELVAGDANDAAMSTPISLDFHVLAPWWRRPWFYGACVLAAVAALVGAWQARVRLLVLQRRRLAAMVDARTAEIEQARCELQRLAMSDVLTGLPNRRAIMQSLEDAVRDALPEALPLAVLLCDVDHFKGINDHHGHQAGDAVLAMFGERLDAAIAAEEKVGRYGGEEFLVILQGVPTEALARAREIRSALTATPYRLGEASQKVTTSGGLAFLRPTDTVAALIARADSALYQAKENGRDRIELERDGTAASRTAALKRDLRDAAGRGEFELHFQPVVDLVHDRVTSCEALLRWHSPGRGDVPPGDFIPFAERNNLMADIDAWVLRTACREAAGWPDAVRVSVNLSSAHFHHPGLVELVSGILAETGLPACRLELEVTETAMISDVTEAAAVLRRLRALGTSIALDDFGTGYSSLSFLRTLPFDRIKIDRSFVRDLGHKPEAAAIIGSVIHLCIGMGAAVTAEGVETPRQIELLRAIGCREIQGFGVGRPMPSRQLRSRLQPRDTGILLAAPVS